MNQPTIMLDPHSKMWTAAGWADNNPWDRMVNPFDDSSLVPRSQLKRVGAILSSQNQQEAVNGVVYVTQVKPFFLFPFQPSLSWVFLT